MKKYRTQQPNDLIASWTARLRPVFVVCAVAIPSLVFGGDWPQVLGPQRSGIADSEDLADTWNDNQPTRIWEVEVGEGYAGPAVKGDQVVVFHRRKNLDYLECFSATDKKQVWSVSWRASYGGGIDSDRGPRCVPLVADGRVYAFSAGGDLHCVDLADGNKLWTRSLGRDFRAQDGYFGFGSSPILIGEHLMVNVGGQRKKAAIVSLDPKSGNVQWTSLSDSASYSAPIAWPTEDGNKLVLISRLNLVGVEPGTGETLFQVPFGATGPTVNAASPVAVDDDRLFVTASYRIGAKCFSLKNLQSPKLLWESDDVLSSQYPTPIYDSGFLYGVHGREDGAPASLRCVAVADGAVRWKKQGVGMAHLIKADGKLLIMTTEGELVLAELTSTAFRERGRVAISSATTRALPALSNGRLFVKDTSGKLTAWKIP